LQPLTTPTNAKDGPLFSQSHRNTSPPMASDPKNATRFTAPRLAISPHRESEKITQIAKISLSPLKSEEIPASIPFRVSSYFFTKSN
jgi:hypothetical protein